MARVFIQQIVNGIKARLPRDIGKEALNNAYITCPIQTGELYSSLYVDISSTGFEFGASALHASDIEEGREAINVSGTYVSKISSHKRTTKSGRITVRAHTKTFQDQKPVLINDAQESSAQVWRTLGNRPAREGTFFMREALDTAIDTVMDNLMAGIGARRK